MCVFSKKLLQVLSSERHLVAIELNEAMTNRMRYVRIARETLRRKTTQMKEDGIISFLDNLLMLVESHESLVRL